MIYKKVLPFIILLFSFPVVGDDQLFSECDKNTSGAFDYRHCVERKISKMPFVLIPYKPNYFVASYVPGLAGGVEEYQGYESKFQISFKIPLSDYSHPTRCLWFDNTQCIAFFGYTQVSVWQMLNFNRSAPFRDTNFEPELMVAQLFAKKPDDEWGLRLINYGLINHQSNGNTPPKSRSWNRSYIDFVFEKNNSYIRFKAWKRWNEGEKLVPSAYIGDDNKDIEKYVGNVELNYFYAGDMDNYSLVIRDSELNPNKINYQLSWSTPLKRIFSFVDNGI